MRIIPYLVISLFFVSISCNKDNPLDSPINTIDYDWIPIERTTDGIVLDTQSVYIFEDVTYNIDYYRNLTYNAGLEGKYSFLVVNPSIDSDAEAPLWVYFHGGGVGYFNDQGIYQSLKFQDSLSWNREETYDNLMEDILGERLFDNDVLIDNTLSRRIKEGYRLLVVSYSDHDLYAGIGSIYPNNPKGGQVNGLQASMSAVDFVKSNYSTTDIYAHGTSAGGYGAYILGVAYYLEDFRLSGIISDSGPLIAEAGDMYDEYREYDDYLHMPTFEIQGVIDKIGIFGEKIEELDAEAMISEGFDIPMLGIAGRDDPFYNCHLPVFSKAIADGFTNNVDWLFNNLIETINQQPNSPHKILILDNTGHVPSIKSDPTASDYVDRFINNDL